MVAKIALGTWLIGGTKDPDPNNDDAKDAAVILTALDNGISLIDTAQNYANGRCEEIIGETLKDRPRSSYQILTKQSKNALSYDEVLKGCEDSMKRLKVDYLDYFVCHAPNPNFDMHDFFKASNKLLSEGKIHGVGVSNFGPRLLKLAIETSDAPIALNQVLFSLTDDDVLDSGTYDFCVKNNIPIQGYRTLVDLKENSAAFAKLVSIASQLGLTPYQVAIAYLNSYKNIVFTLRASSKQHWDEIKSALDIKLSKENIVALRSTHKGITTGRRDYLEQ
ncbi:MAG TPA: aldo/keto reductase [Candidatus Saccharimonadales bacterium]